MFSTKFVFFGPIGNKMAAKASDWLTHFRLLLWNRWRELEETWQKDIFSNSPLKPLNRIQQTIQKARSQHLLLSWGGGGGWLEKQDGWNEVCVSFADWKNKMAAKASDWLTHFQPLLKPLNGTQGNLTGPQCPLPSLCFSGGSEKQMVALASDWLRHFRLLLWNRWMKFNSTKLDRNQDLNVLYQVCVFHFRPNWKIRWPPWPLIGF